MKIILGKVASDSSFEKFWLFMKKKDGKGDLCLKC